MCSRDVQALLAGHILPAVRVFETPDLKNVRLTMFCLILSGPLAVGTSFTTYDYLHIGFRKILSLPVEYH